MFDCFEQLELFAACFLQLRRTLVDLIPDTRSEGEEPFRHVVISLKREERRERRPRPDRSRNPEE